MLGVLMYQGTGVPVYQWYFHQVYWCIEILVYRCTGLLC